MGLKSPYCDKLKSSLSLDHLGGTNVVTDDVGEVKEVIEYMPYGKESRRDKFYADPAQQARYTFANQYKDAETGLIFMQARYYDPSLGRFITPDTVIPGFSNPQALNRYSYVLNNPVNRIDPSGNWSFKKFFKSFISAFVQVSTTIVLTPFIGPVAAGAVGGFLGGALYAGLNGASFGQAMMSGLVGAGIGALGGAAFGSTGANGFLGALGPKVGLGLLAVGAGVATATDNLDSFSGGLVGGVGGLVAGKAVSNAISGPSIKTPQQAQKQQQKSNNSLKTNQSPKYKKTMQVWKRGELVPEFDGGFGENGNFIKAPDVGNRRITVLGAQDDLGPFLDNPLKYNVLNPNKSISWSQNQSFINQAVQNGDQFFIMRSPQNWSKYTTSVYGQSSRLTAELNMLQQSGVGSSRITNFY